MVPNTFRARLEDASLPPAAFGHPEHLRLAYDYLVEHADFADAARAFRTTLRRYTATIGAADKFHETITWTYLALVREAMEEGHTSADALFSAHPELLDHRCGALSRIFDVDAVTRDPLARRILVLPRMDSK